MSALIIASRSRERPREHIKRRWKMASVWLKTGAVVAWAAAQVEQMETADA